jgi:hypothetical protein
MFKVEKSKDTPKNTHLLNISLIKVSAFYIGIDLSASIGS